MLEAQHLGGFFTGLAALLGAVITPIVTLVLHRRQMEKQAGQLKDHMEAQVRKANGVPFAFIENLPDPAWCKGIDGKMLWINYEYSQQWGIRPSDYEGKFDYDIWPADTVNHFREHDLRVVHDRVTLATTELVPDRIKDPRSPKRKWLVRKFPVFNSKNEVIAVGGIAWLHGETFGVADADEDTAAVRVQ